MSKAEPHEFVEPESGTRDASFGWCAREDCGSTRDAYVHASQEERDRFERFQNPEPRIESVVWTITATADSDTRTHVWMELAPSPMAALIQISEKRSMGLG